MILQQTHNLGKQNTIFLYQYLLWWCCAWSWWLMHCNYFRNQVIFILIFMILILSVRWFFTVGMGRPEIWVTIVVIWIWPVKKIKIIITIKNKPERVFGLQVRSRELDIFKILGIFGNSVFTLLKSAKLFEYERDFGFASRQKKEGKFRSLKVRVQAYRT